jgi:hypothetical protein
MRTRNWRVIYSGAVLFAVAVGFFFFMMSIANTSNDPATMLRTVGEVSGVAAAFGLVMIVTGLIGKKA